MSVNPGFGGQTFIPYTLDKLAQARELIDRSGKPIRLEVDGGVNLDTIGSTVLAGADTFVAGSAIFGAPDYRQAVADLRAKIDRKSTRLNSSHVAISYAVFCLKKKNTTASTT